MWDVTFNEKSILRTDSEFLLTHPVWDVTAGQSFRRLLLKISTHTSRVGCDQVSGTVYDIYEISTHTSRVGCDRYI